MGRQEPHERGGVAPVCGSGAYERASPAGTHPRCPGALPRCGRGPWDAAAGRHASWPVRAAGAAAGPGAVTRRGCAWVKSFFSCKISQRTRRFSGV
jgi:hypothetical protein